jgi:hypothetical protein
MQRADAACKTREDQLQMKSREARMKTKEEGLLAMLGVLGIAALLAYLVPDHSPGHRQVLRTRGQRQSRRLQDPVL